MTGLVDSHEAFVAKKLDSLPLPADGFPKLLLCLDDVGALAGKFDSLFTRSTDSDSNYQAAKPDGVTTAGPGGLVCALTEVISILFSGREWASYLTGAAFSPRHTARPSAHIAIIKVFPDDLLEVDRMTAIVQSYLNLPANFLEHPEYLDGIQREEMQSRASSKFADNSQPLSILPDYSSDIFCEAWCDYAEVVMEILSFARTGSALLSPVPTKLIKSSRAS